MKEDIEDEEEDLTGSVWLPVILESKTDKGANDKVLSDPSIKEIDLAEISEKEVFVRKADLVYLLLINIIPYRMISRKASRIASQRSM